MEKKYKEGCINLAKDMNVEVSEHIIRIMTSVMLHRDNIRKGGGFVEAVVNNDLQEAFLRADDECRKNMEIIVMAKIFYIE